MSRVLLKLRLILWKNLIIRRRHLILTILEVAIPVALCFINLFLTSLVPKAYIPETTYYEPKNVNHFEGPIRLYYSPNNTKVEKFMKNVDEQVKPQEFLGFSNEKDMIKFITDDMNNRTDNFIYKFQYIGVVFDNFPEREKDSKNLNYRIRTYMSDKYAQIFPEYKLESSLNDRSDYYEGYPFVKIQHAVDMAFIKWVSPDNSILSKINVTIQKLPYPPHRNNAYTDLIKELFPLLTSLGFVVLFMNVLKRAIEEKSTGIKELMKMMGLEPWMCWIGWFIYGMAVNVISVTAITVLLSTGLSEKYPGVIVKGNPFIMWLFLMLYVINLLSFVFFCSTLFKKPAQGSSIGIAIWFLLPFIGNYFVTEVPTSKILQHVFMLVPNINLRLGFNAIIEFEKREGINFSNIFTIPSIYAAYPPMGCVLSAFIGVTLLLLLLTWYIENVYPGEFGVGRSWYFPFTKSYWISNRISSDDYYLDSLSNKPEFEKVSEELKPGIQLRHLYKKFNNVNVVKDLSFDIYQNQITVLLGHNGAGKTTTMNMITGMTAPSNGSIIVNGYDIGKYLDEIRKSLGLCPQFSVQFTDLTVKEHLMFFAMLKGSRKQEAEREAKELLDKLHLLDKQNVMAGKLSGGMRRKLSLAIAIVGRSSTLILDEPTSGLDPEARREIWDFLLNMRGERTILITTHYMEEADILGDQIAIMHNGSLQCYGSTLFLKKHYGTGYVLSILVENQWETEEIKHLIQQYVPAVAVKSSTGNSITFSLPTNDTSALSKLFKTLEEKKSQFNITNFGVSITTMEDVFLKVGEIADELDKGTTKNQRPTNHFLEDDESLNSNEDNIKDTFPLMKQQFKGLLIKRFHYIRRRWITFLLALGIPLALILIAFITTNIQNSTPSNSTDFDVRFDLKLEKYPKTMVFYTNSPNKEAIALSDIYSDLVRKQNAMVSNVPNISDTVVDIGKKDMDKYERSLVVSADFIQKGDVINLNARYGSLALHGIPISLNLLSNTLLQYMNPDKYVISVTNNPIPVEHDAVAKDILENLKSIITWMFLIPIAFTMMFGLLIIFPHEERMTGVLHLQCMAGVSKLTYWLSNFVVDYTVYFLLSFVTFILLLIFDNIGCFTTPQSSGAFILLLFMFGFAMLPLAYALTFKKNTSGILSLMISLQVFIGGIGAIIFITLISIGSTGADPTKRDIAMYIFYLFPQFAFSYGIFVFTKHSYDIHEWLTNTDYDQKMALCVYQNNPCCKDEDTSECKEFLTFFGSEYNSSIRNPVIFMAIHFFLYSAILLFFESEIPTKLYNKLKDIILKVKRPEEMLSDDVKEEKERIEDQLRNRSFNDILLAKNLKKWYNRKTYAVRNLNFGVKPGECFGLLGVNGAGKTTTFKMLTGDIVPSEGESYVSVGRHDLSIVHNRSEYLKNIGYCPQFDALNFNLTGRQMLKSFAYLRGVPDNKINYEIEKWLDKCGIKQYENKVCQKYSGGNKRKLSMAIALIGSPPLLMLDEPTCGIDPVARRKLWDILSSIRKVGQSIVLTTHSMEECEALCDRLAIMVDGQFRCIGNIQTLKSNYGTGFTVIIKLQSNTGITDLKGLMYKKFKCTIKDEHQSMLHYHISPENTSIGDIFTFMEGIKNSNNSVEDYTVNDTSLEELFLSFAKTKYAPSTSHHEFPLIGNNQRDYV